MRQERTRLDDLPVAQPHHDRQLIVDVWTAASRDVERTTEDHHMVLDSAHLFDRDAIDLPALDAVLECPTSALMASVAAALQQISGQGHLKLGILELKEGLEISRIPRGDYRLHDLDVLP
jgi:hypothetical protein